MKKITVHCNSGSDSECFGTVDVHLPYAGSYAANPNWVFDNDQERKVVESVSIMPDRSQRKQWLEANRHHLTEEQKELIITQGFFDLDYDDIDDKEVCGACGTDQEHGDDDD